MSSSERSLVARAALLGLLAIAVLLLCVNLDALFGVAQRMDHRSSKELVTSAERMLWQQSRSALLQTEYQTLTEEIRLRLEQEHQLFALKFALIGAILVTALQGSRAGQLNTNAFAALIGWAAVVTAAIVDLRIASNQAVLRALGGWVRRYEELILGFPAVGLGWEAYLADRGVHAGARLGGQVLTAVLFITIATLFFGRRRRDNDPTTALLSGAGAVLSVLLMTLSAIGFPLSTARLCPVIPYAIVAVVALITACWLARTSYSREGG